MRFQRRTWLDELAEFQQFEAAGAFVSILWHAVDDHLIANGWDPLPAFGMAIRCCRIAVMLLLHVERREIAIALGVSERTVKSDVQRLRDVVESGVLLQSQIARRPLPRKPSDRVRIPARRQRRRPK